MKIEGNEKELRNLFKEKTNSIFNMTFRNKLNNKMSKKTKNLIIFSTIIISIFLLSLIAIQIYYDISDNYVTNSECSKLIGTSITSLETITWQNQLIFSIKPLIGFLLFCLGVSWVFHGVGFRIIR